MDKHPQPPIFVGVDTGGTFTDLILVCGGEVRSYKLPSTPEDPSTAVLAGIALLTTENPKLFHGSTVATNALLEGKTDPVALIVTAGFKDLLAIGRQNRHRLYALHPENRRAIVAPENIIEVVERILPDGSVQIPLTEAEVLQAAEKVKERGIKSVAICLLHGYANPSHEQMLAAALSEQVAHLSLASVILPEYREFERAATTTVNAAVSPVMNRYLSRIEEQVGQDNLKIMQSNGGAIQARTAGEEAVRTILSGPAGGIIGAMAVARAAGEESILTFDMGGTSTDVALCQKQVPFTSETLIAGWPVKVPMIAIHTVGAGGGSIARIDPGGALKVGPESAGADPGPVCYGRGKRVTVTDANLFLGRLLPDRFLGGRMPLATDRCRAAIESLAAQAGLPSGQLAEGVLEIAEEKMAAALRVVSVEKGFDPRNFSLLPFGGAGGLHACALAEKLGMTRILIPCHPGLLSAAGMLLSDTIRDYSFSVLQRAAALAGRLEEHFLPLVNQAVEDFAKEGIAESERHLEPSLDLRYRGQSFEVTVPAVDDFITGFHAEHERLYGYREENREVEVVNLRLRAIGAGPHPQLWPRLKKGPMPSPAEEICSVVDGADILCPVYLREDLPAGGICEGPAVIVEETATHFIRPQWQVRVSDTGHLHLTRREYGQ